MITWFKALISGNGFLVALIAGISAFGALAIYDQSRVRHGQALERAKTEAANAKAVTDAQSARLRARNGFVGGVRDPHAVD